MKFIQCMKRLFNYIKSCFNSEPPNNVRNERQMEQEEDILVNVSALKCDKKEDSEQNNQKDILKNLHAHLMSNDAENLLNLPSQEQIQANAREMGIPLIISNSARSRFVATQGRNNDQKAERSSNDKPMNLYQRLMANAAENLLNLPSQEQIRANAREMGISLVMPKLAEDRSLKRKGPQ